MCYDDGRRERAGSVRCPSRLPGSGDIGKGRKNGNIYCKKHRDVSSSSGVDIGKLQGKSRSSVEPGKPNKHRAIRSYPGAKGLTSWRELRYVQAHTCQSCLARTVKKAEKGIGRRNEMTRLERRKRLKALLSTASRPDADDLVAMGQEVHQGTPQKHGIR